MMKRMTLTEFLLARIAEDEATARAAEGGADWWAYYLDGRMTHDEPKWIVDSERRLISYEVTSEGSARHIGAWSPARVLTECEARRRIVEQAELLWMEDGGVGRLVEDIVRLLAMPYADHPDWGDEWQPDPS